MRARDVVAALRKHLPPNRWAFFPELIVRDTMGREERRLDVWAISFWPSDQYCRACYEVKVSRGDWLQELRNPKKRRLGLLMSNEFWLATPRGLVKPEELPPEFGLLEVDREGRCHVVKQAPWRETLPPTWAMVSAVARRTQREEMRPMVEAAEIALGVALDGAIRALFDHMDLLRQVVDLEKRRRTTEDWREYHRLSEALKDRLREVAQKGGLDWLRAHGEHLLGL